jgi:hypothetical protein
VFGFIGGKSFLLLDKGKCELKGEPKADKKSAKVVLRIVGA